MSCPILITSDPILLIGAGPASEMGIKSAFAKSDKLICADGGVKHAVSAGLTPDLVVGDMDSATALDLKGVTHHKIDDQDTTDLQKALAHIDAPLVLATGVLGGRLDHQLALFSALLLDARPIIAFDDASCVFVAPVGQTFIKVPAGAEVGFYPLVPVLVTIQGTKWAVENILMRPEGLISTSNKMASDTLSIETDRRGLLCILPVANLDQLMSALLI